MGRYRELVKALVQHTNINMQVVGVKDPVVEGIWLTPNEWQIMEYIIEHPEDTACMNDISVALGLPQSSFSKTIKLLAYYGLVEKYQRENNHKNVLLRPTARALEVYAEKKERVNEKLFAGFFEALSGVDDAALKQFTDALMGFNEVLQKEGQKRLQRWKEAKRG